MPKIKIRNLSAEINRRIRLIKTLTSIVEVGEQNGAVIESAEYMGICLAPKSNQFSCEGASQIAAFRMSFPQIDNWSLLYNDPLNFLGFADMYIDDQSVGYNIGSDWVESGVDVIVKGLWNGSPPTGTQEWLNGAHVEFRSLNAVEHRVKFQSIHVENFILDSNPTIHENGFKAYGFCLSPNSDEISCEGATTLMSFIHISGDWEIYVDDMENPSVTGSIGASLAQLSLDYLGRISFDYDGFLYIINQEYIPHRFKFVPISDTSFNTFPENPSFIEHEDGSLTFCLSAIPDDV